MRERCIGLKGFDALEELALNLSWTWNHKADEIWKRLDPNIWKLTRNPWIVLQTISQEKIKKELSDPEFLQLVDELVNANRSEHATPGWFKQTYPSSPLKCVAYFSMEFMMTEGLPIYSGGLGNVAGDQLKVA